MLSNSVSVQSGCFFDKLMFVNADGTGFTPRNPGICNFSSSVSNSLTGTMDVDDFIASFEFMLFTGRSSSSILITGSSPVFLVPGVRVNTMSSALVPSVFTELTVMPALVAFDLDLNTLLLHFNGLMDSSTFLPGMLMLFAGSSSQASPVPLTSSFLVAGTPRYTTTLCVTLPSQIRAALDVGSICGGTSACFCNVSSGLVANYLRTPIPESSPLQVSTIQKIFTASVSNTFLI